MRRIWGLLIGMVLVLSLTYVAAEKAGWTDQDFVQQTVERIRATPGGQGAVAMALIGLLALDLALPVPSSVVMTLSGTFLGAIPGALAAFAGAMTSSCLGFGLCRAFGRKAFVRLVGPGDEARVDRFMKTYGLWAILLSRSVPMLTEIVSCFAGLGRLSFRRFLALSATGALPLCLAYAWAGSRGHLTGNGWAVWLAFVFPGLGFAAIRLIERRAVTQGPPLDP